MMKNSKMDLALMSTKHGSSELILETRVLLIKENYEEAVFRGDRELK